MESSSRREFLTRLAQAAGVAVLWPVASACVRDGDAPAPAAPAVGATPAPAASANPGDTPHTVPTPGVLPRERPSDWDPIGFNRERGNAGAIPASYLPDINGPDGEGKHVGKHLPFIVPIPGEAVAGVVGLMWGDPSKGHAPHPNARPNEAHPGGHFYDWIRIRKATDGDADEMQSLFTAWPLPGPADSGRYAAAGPQGPEGNDGKDTIYVCRLPDGVGPGDTVRVYAHCRTHGQYVDFLTLPA